MNNIFVMPLLKREIKSNYKVFLIIAAVAHVSRRDDKSRDDSSELFKNLFIRLFYVCAAYDI